MVAVRGHRSLSQLARAATAVASICTGAGLGCNLTLATFDNTVITCARNADCPPGYSCRASTNRCGPAVDKTAPSVTSIGLLSSTPTNATAVSFGVAFSEIVSA